MAQTETSKYPRGLFSEGRPTPAGVWALYEEGRRFKSAVNLYDTVVNNENFFIGKQWEGVQANGLPTPVFNFLKKDVSFVVASITTDNIKISARPLAATPETRALREPARILNEEFESIFAENDIVRLAKEYARDAAVRGDGCLYTYWDADAETGQLSKGAIRTEIIKNTRVFFGNPNDKRVESQPYIIVESREIVRLLRQKARENGADDWEAIDSDEDNAPAGGEQRTDDKATKLFIMWKGEDGEVWGYECTEKVAVKAPWSLGIRRYPITWLCWDYVDDSYHGQAMITGLIPNQIFVNKIWAMTMLSAMMTAYPKVIYDKTRIRKWTNQVGQAIGVAGGDMNTVAKTLNGAMLNPQISELIELAIDQTNRNLGVNAAATGDVRPDNTSAIIALQRAAATPSETTKLNLQHSIEDLGRIYLEFIAEYYGKRRVDVPSAGTEAEEIHSFAGTETPEEIAVDFDFSVFKDMPMSFKLDVGASSYYSEIASIQTLDQLLVNGKITTSQYLERLPDGYIPDKAGLARDIKAAEEAAKASQAVTVQ